MISGQKVLAVIPARGGSKGIPRKNLRMLGGKPLLAWTIKAAEGSRYIDRTVLSSDDEEIISVARAWGCEAPFVRPAELARDDTPGIEPVLHALRTLPGYGFVVLLQPTSPLRTAADIDACLERCIDAETSACVSVTQAGESPYWMFTLQDNHLVPVLEGATLPERRQDLPLVYSLNGAVYVARVEWLMEHRAFLSTKTAAYVMPSSRSVDVDEEVDLKLIQLLIDEKEHGPISTASYK